VKTEHATRIYFEQLKRVVSLMMVLSHYGIELRKQGQQLVGPCPIHQGSNKRQFVVKPATSEWHCFSPSCGRGGAMLEFVAAMENVEIFEAARLVARWFAIETGNQPQSQQQERRRSSMSESNQPTHRVYSARRREGAEKDDLTLIGSGWVFNTKNGKGGMNIQLSAMPIGERMVIFERDPEWEAQHKREKEEPASNGKSFKKK
jgi:hypothetical protein